ncbi:hypothetical protein Tco_0844457 [Tanacetum coccineum]
MKPSHFNAYQYPYNNSQFKQQFSPSQSPHYGSIPPTQHYSTTYPSTPLEISYPSTPYPNAYSSTVHKEACPQPPSVPQIEYTASTVNQQIHLAKFPQIDSGLAVPGRQSSFAAGTFGTRANISGTRGNNSGSSKVLNEEELEFLADVGVAEGPVSQTVITHNASYQADDFDAYDSDCNDFSTAKAILMANLSSYGSDVLSEDTNSSTQQEAMILYVFEQLSNQVTNCNKVNKNNLIGNESLSAELERYKEGVKLLEERQNVNLSTQEKLIMDDIVREKNAQFADFEKEINYLKQLFRNNQRKKNC